MDAQQDSIIQRIGQLQDLKRMVWNEARTSILDYAFSTGSSNQRIRAIDAECYRLWDERRRSMSADHRPIVTEDRPDHRVGEHREPGDTLHFDSVDGVRIEDEMGGRGLFQTCRGQREHKANVSRSVPRGMTKGALSARVGSKK